MKKFNLNLAKSGVDLITRNGKDAKILLFDRDSRQFPVVAIISNKLVHYYTRDGQYFLDKDSDLDLFLK